MSKFNSQQTDFLQFEQTLRTPYWKLAITCDTLSDVGLNSKPIQPRKNDTVYTSYLNSSHRSWKKRFKERQVCLKWERLDTDTSFYTNQYSPLDKALKEGVSNYTDIMWLVFKLHVEVQEPCCLVGNDASAQQVVRLLLRGWWCWCAILDLWFQVCFLALSWLPANKQWDVERAWVREDVWKRKRTRQSTTPAPVSIYPLKSPHHTLTQTHRCVLSPFSLSLCHTHINR